LLIARYGRNKRERGGEGKRRRRRRKRRGLLHKWLRFKVLEYICLLPPPGNRRE